MKLQYLEFEKPIKELDQAIAELGGIQDSVELTPELKKLVAKRESTIKKIHAKLNRWQRVQLARHPSRPYSLDYIHLWSPDFLELHGDRLFADDHAVITGLGDLESIPVVYIAQQKGRNTKDNLYRNFGMMRPEGYRKALRVMKLAEKFHRPVVTLIDTIGAYPGIGAEERGQGEAIARNLLEMARLKTPIISVVIGEGASGGALGIGVCDRLLMLENTWFSVISPEGCASILWRDAAKAPVAAEALKLIPRDLEAQGICDRIIPEPPGGAHRNPGIAAQQLRTVLIEEIRTLQEQDSASYLDRRIERYQKLGAFA
ncbi:MAG: acetyl-CoA carboxylase carboxyltransferase subunit alpha [FCB group bacterium]|nr:acetyl-CoA carboxylase carboxyltransferase subunit alpha [FCB group bacterium]